ncbi:hypothetical protein KMM349_08710 [Stenotrophomonas maltophilia]|nr:hypothetical protein KMM349_08710 [Stenotrophomonas maltophilia]
MEGTGTGCGRGRHAEERCKKGAAEDGFAVGGQGGKWVHAKFHGRGVKCGPAATPLHERADIA